MRRLLLGGAVAAALMSAAPSIAQAPDPAPESVSLNCDAITYHTPLDPTVVKELEPIHSLDGVAAALAKHHIVFGRSKGVVTVALPAPIRNQLDNLPAGEPIILPARDGGIVCVLIPGADSI